jgi:hypothetical protein
MADKARRLPASLRFWVLTALALGLVSCGGTTLRTSWRDPQYQGGPLKKIAVLVVDRSENRRRFAEDEIVRNLPAGTQAVPGHSFLGPLDANPDKDKIRDRLVSEGFDGALVARLVGIIEKESAQPSQPSPSRPAPAYSGVGFYDPSSPKADFPDYYSHAAGQATSPASPRGSTDVVVEMQLFVLPAGKAIWTGLTDSTNPESRQALVERITEIVGGRLRSEGLLGGQ